MSETLHQWQVGDKKFSVLDCGGTLMLAYQAIKPIKLVAKSFDENTSLAGIFTEESLSYHIGELQKEQSKNRTGLSALEEGLAHIQEISQKREQLSEKAFYIQNQPFGLARR